MRLINSSVASYPISAIIKISSKLSQNSLSTDLLLKNKYSKTIILGSDNTNELYLYTERMLILGNKNIYGKTKDIFVNLDYSNYNIKKPDLVSFIDLAHKHGHNIEYSQDIRDLIKDVYKDVTK